MAKNRYIIHEKPGIFELEVRPAKEIIKTSSSFETLYEETKAIANGDDIFGITHIGKKTERHPKFQSFKTPKACSYPFE